MPMTTPRIADLTTYLDAWAPPAYQENYDNAGLLVGHPTTPITGVLVSLDVTEAIVAEAVARGCNMVVAHHPIVFKGLKKLNGHSYVERTVINAIKNDVAIFAAHTNLDHITGGVNTHIASRLGLTDVQILAPKSGTLSKLVVYVPEANVAAVLVALHTAGAGKIGPYDQCSFRVGGTGTFRPLHGANPAVGQVGQTESGAEQRLEVLLPTYLEKAVVRAMRQAHPYEMPAYDLFALTNTDPTVGAGAVGNLPHPLPETNWLRHLKTTMQTPVVRHTPLTGRAVGRVAVCGGAGSFLLPHALRAGADAFVTADYKYHEFFDAESKLVICDIGHYESEVFTKDLIAAYLRRKFTTFAVILADTDTNPVQYFF